MRRPDVMAAIAGLCIAQVAEVPWARERDTRPRVPVSLDESPVGGYLAIRDVVVDGRSLGWTELVEYRSTLYAPGALLDSLGLEPRPGALVLHTRFEVWFALNDIPGVRVRYDLSHRRVSLATDAPASRLPTASPTTVPAAAPPAAPDTPIARADAGEKLMPVEVTVNGARAGSWLLLEKGGVLYATPDAFEEWRLSRDPSEKAIEYRGRQWYPLSSIPGYEARFNFADQSLELRFRASEFAATRLGAPRVERPPLSRVLPSLFVNYDLSRTVTSGKDFETRHDLGALAELGYSSSLGLLTSSYVGRNLEDDPNGSDARSWRRLETTFTRDYPEDNLSLRLGDSTTRAGMWGRQVYFGGVQLGRNFALSPGLITYPLPIIAGQSSAPSTVELYVNDVLRQTSQVPTGPFTIDNFPLLTGSGQARVVVRDLLGRETVLVQDFYAAAELLDAGLSDWSAEIGAVRRNLGVENADYGQNFASGLWRYGIDRERTVEARAEYGEETRGAGLGLSMVLPWQLLGQVALAGSRNDVAGNGGRAIVGLQHSSLRDGFSIRAEANSRDYRQIGTETGALPVRSQLSAGYTSYAGRGTGYSYGLAIARIDRYDEEPLTTASANLTYRVGARSSLTFSASHVSGATKADTIGVSLLVPFDNRVAATANVTHRDAGTDGYVGVSQGLGAEIGVGWRALAGKRAGESYGEGGLYYQGSHGLLTADAHDGTDVRTSRLGAQGALVAADGTVFATRRLQNSFAVVEVAGYDNVGVGFQSSVYARTDSSGRALVPNLQPYRKNSIRLDPNELPISAELDSIEQVAVPGTRSGVKVVFPVRPGRGALIKIELEDGRPAPAGAVVAIKGDDKEFYVARRGEAFVTGLQASNVVSLRWKDQTCDVKIELPPGKKDDIARVGPVVCTGVAR